MSHKIKKVKSREVLDSRGFPTVEVELSIASDQFPGGSVTGRALVPSGASTGEGEAVELRDGDLKRYLGKGVQKAVGHVREQLASAMEGRSFATQALVDELLCSLDGTPNKGKLGANAILGVSMAFARAAALVEDRPLYQSLGQLAGKKANLLPVPLMNILNGGKHADNGLNLQEFMIVPVGFDRFSEALRAGAEVFHRLKKILHDRNLSTGVGDEGGFAPVFAGSNPHEQAIQAILQAIGDAGYKAGRDIYLALDAAASEFIDPTSGRSTVPSGGSVSDKEVNYLFEGKRKSSLEMISLYSQWVKMYPILSIEDGLGEHDWTGWSQLTAKLGSQCQLVGDDLFVTNPEFLKRGIEQEVANSILIKLNQIGTVSETLETMKMASAAHYTQVVSHRSGETEDTFIADLAVATCCGQIKTGSASRTDRIAKYNQLLRIEEGLGNAAQFAGAAAFPKLQAKR